MKGLINVSKRATTTEVDKLATMNRTAKEFERLIRLAGFAYGELIWMRKEINELVVDLGIEAELLGEDELNARMRGLLVTAKMPLLMEGAPVNDKRRFHKVIELNAREITRKMKNRV